MALNQRVQLGPALQARLQGIRPRLSEKEQRVASFLEEDPQGFISQSISAVADRCGVSETVIIRLYRKLGYTGYHQFKIDVAQSLTEAVSDGLGSLRAGDSLDTIKRKVFALSRQALEESIESVDNGELQRACEALLRARRIVIAAFGGSASVGLDLQHKLLKLGMVATLYTDPHMQVMATAVFGPDDLLIAVSHSGNSRDIVDALELAAAAGAMTLLITGFPHSPAAKAAQINLVAVSRETEYQTDSMTSRMVQLAVVDTLYIALIFARKESATATIHRTSVAAARKKL